MRMQAENRSNATVEQVYAARIEQGVREDACRESGAVDFKVTVQRGGDGGAEVLIERTMRPDVPEAFKAFVGDTIGIRQVETWAPATADGERIGQVRITIDGKPASMVGISTLSPDGVGSVERVDGEIKIGIPFIGRLVEPEIAKALHSALERDQQAGEKWISQQH